MTITIVDTAPADEEVFVNDQVVYDEELNAIQGRLKALFLAAPKVKYYYRKEWRPWIEAGLIDSEFINTHTTYSSDLGVQFRYGAFWGPADGDYDFRTTAWTYEFETADPITVVRLEWSASKIFEDRNEQVFLGYLVRNEHNTLRFDNEIYNTVATPPLQSTFGYGWASTPRTAQKTQGDGDKGPATHTSKQYRYFGPGKWRLNLFIKTRANSNRDRLLLTDMHWSVAILGEIDVEYAASDPPYIYDGTA